MQAVRLKARAHAANVFLIGQVSFLWWVGSNKRNKTCPESVALQQRCVSVLGNANLVNGALQLIGRGVALMFVDQIECAHVEPAEVPPPVGRNRF